MKWEKCGAFSTKLVLGFGASILFVVVYVDVNLLAYGWLQQAYLNSPWVVFVTAPINIYESGPFEATFTSVIFKAVFYNTNLLIPLAGLVLSEAIEFVLYGIKKKEYTPLLTTKGALLFGAIATYMFSGYQRADELIEHDLKHVGAGSSIIGFTMWLFIFARCLVICFAVLRRQYLGDPQIESWKRPTTLYVSSVLAAFSGVIVYGFYLAGSAPVPNHLAGGIFFSILCLIYMPFRRRSQFESTLHAVFGKPKRHKS